MILAVCGGGAAKTVASYVLCQVQAISVMQRNLCLFRFVRS